MFGPFSKVLVALWRIDPIQSDFVLGAVFKNGDRIAIRNANLTKLSKDEPMAQLLDSKDLGFTQKLIHIFSRTDRVVPVWPLGVRFQV